MDDIKTLVEEAKRLARGFAAAHLREALAEATGRLTLANSDEEEAAMDAALDALAEAHQAEVARLTRENEGLATDLVSIRSAWNAAEAEFAGLAKDAARYRWLRECAWFASPLCVLRNPKAVLTRGNALGADCPSQGRLDAAIDSELATLAGASGADEGERT